MGSDSLSCSSEQTDNGVLFVHMGTINQFTGITNDTRMKTLKVNKESLFLELISLKINPQYLINSRTEVRTRLINPFTGSQFPDATKNILYHAYEIFHLIDEYKILPDLYVSIERQQHGVIMQISSNKDVVLKWFQGTERKEKMEIMPLEPMDLSFAELVEIFESENYLNTRYFLPTNNCQIFLKRLNHTIDEKCEKEN